MQPLKIGAHTIDVPLILAPMAGVTDRPFRQLCKSLGAGLAVSEMVGAGSLLQGSEKTWKRACHAGETLPCSVQIVGSDPKQMALAAKINEDQGAQLIDINMGCPAKKVCNTLAGSALLKDEPLVGRILEAVVNAVQIPVTLKIRTGWDVCNRNGVQIGLLAQSLGVQALSVHGRTRACKFQGEAEYDTIAAIKAALSIPVIANGDITTPEKAKLVLEQTKADGLMIGRGAQGNPWIFKEIAHYLDTGTHLAKPDAAEIRDTLLGHMEALRAFYGDHALHIARKHVSWYSKGLPHAAHFRETFNRLQDIDAQLRLIEQFFDTQLIAA